MKSLRLILSGLYCSVAANGGCVITTITILENSFNQRGPVSNERRTLRSIAASVRQRIKTLEI